jgi:hypothetical protein
MICMCGVCRRGASFERVWWVDVLQTFWGMFSTCPKMFVARQDGLLRVRATVLSFGFIPGFPGGGEVLRGLRSGP